MLKPSLLIVLSLGCVSGITRGQDSASTQSKSIALHQTASALRVVLPTAIDVEDVNVLAKLGDFTGADVAVKRIQDTEAQTRGRSIVAQYMAKAALKSGQLALAEKRIVAMKGDYGAAELWLELSRRYGEKKRLVDAKRTAFYATTQVRREQNFYSWPPIAQRLCDLGERDAARRLFAIAQRELLDPDPLWGSAQDPVIEAAARCGFDDIAFATKGSWAYGVTGIWALQNKDAVARRFIDQKVKESLAKPVSKAPASSDQTISPQQVAVFERVFYLLPLAQGQYERGDVAAARATWQESDALLDQQDASSQWFAFKVQNLRAYEATAQWDLADARGVQLQADLAQLQTSSSAPSNPPPPRPGQSPKDLAALLDTAQLSCLNVIDHPEKFSRQQRLEALERVQPRLSQYASRYPQSQGRVLLALARAQKALDVEGWRSTLQRAQEVAWKEATQGDNWVNLAAVAKQWRIAGEAQPARTLGNNLLNLWRTRRPQTPRLRSGIVGILIECGLFEEASHLLIPGQGTTEKFSSWGSEVSRLTQAWKTAPPAELLRLAPATRHQALLAWGKGLVPEASPEDQERTFNPLGDPLR